MKEKILDLLLKNRFRFLSGEEISKVLGVTRTAIWKQINGLREDGYKIESVKRQGYRLTELPDNLCAEEIRLRLQSDFIRDIYVLAETASTNEVAKKKAIAGAPQGTIVLAEKQLAGKGRMGRTWVSPAGSGIWLSIILRPPIRPAQAAQLTFVNAVGACTALREQINLPVTIKWPNDLMLNERKICGILTELSAEIDRVNYVIVGLGLNVNQRRQDFPADIQDKATSLASESGNSFRRVDLLLAVLNSIEKSYKEYCHEGFRPILGKWRELNSTLGREVHVVTQDESYYGIAEEVDEEGKLLVRKANGRLESVLAGDVSIRI